MRILQVHKYLYRKAGAEAYFLDLAQLLAKHGQEVKLWGTDHNPPQPSLILREGDRSAPPLSSKGGSASGGKVRGGVGGVMRFNALLVEYLNFDRREGVLRDIRKFGHMVWSREAARKFERVVSEFKPEVIHLHNIYHHISPSILPVAVRHRVPVVMTVHDWHLVNPNYALFDHGEICERNGWRAVAHRCIKNSYAASLADVLEWRAHRMLRVYEKYVAKFIAPNEFVKRKLVEGGMDGKKIEVAPLAVGSRFTVHGSRLGDYILFAGRLTEEKGIYLLLEMAKRLPDIQFKIAGTGPEFENLKFKIKNEKLLNVEMLGFLEKEKLPQIIAGARLVIVPSLWHDLSPLSVLEAQAAGKVVVASKIGGIPELIEEGKTGFLVPIRNYEIDTKSTKIHNPPPPPLNLRGGVTDWVDKIKKLWHDEKLLERVGKAAQSYVKRAHDPEKHYDKIMEIYGRVIRY